MKAKMLDDSKGAISRMLFFIEDDSIPSQDNQMRKLPEYLKQLRKHPDFNGIEFWIFIPQHVYQVLWGDEKKNFLEDKIIRIDLDFRALKAQYGRNGWICNNPSHQTSRNPSTPTPFVQDHFMVLTNDCNDTILLDPYYTWLDGKAYGCTTSDERCLSEIVNDLLPSIISSQTPALTKACRYFFEGGNVISIGEFALVGMDIIYRNLLAFHPDLLKKWPLNEGHKDRFFDFLDKLAEGFCVEKVLCPGLKISDEGLSFLGKKVGTGGPALRKGMRHLDQFLLYLGSDSNNPKSKKILLAKYYQPHTATNGDFEWKPAADTEYLQRDLDYMRNWFVNPADFGFDGCDISFDLTPIPTMIYYDQLLTATNGHLHFSNGKQYILLAKLATGRRAASLPHQKADALIVQAYANIGIEVYSLEADFLFNAPSANAGLHCLTKVLQRD